VVSPEPFSHGTGTLLFLQKKMATYRHWSVSLWRDPDDVSHCRIPSPDKTEWRLKLISATLYWWRRRFVADQLWLMTCIRKEKKTWVFALMRFETAFLVSDQGFRLWSQRKIKWPTVAEVSVACFIWTAQHINQGLVIGQDRRSSVRNQNITSARSAILH